METNMTGFSIPHLLLLLILLVSMDNKKNEWLLNFSLIAMLQMYLCRGSGTHAETHSQLYCSSYVMQ